MNFLCFDSLWRSLSTMVFIGLGLAISLALFGYTALNHFFTTVRWYYLCTHQWSNWIYRQCHHIRTSTPYHSLVNEVEIYLHKISKPSWRKFKFCKACDWLAWDFSFEETTRWKIHQQLVLQVYRIYYLCTDSKFTTHRRKFFVRLSDNHWLQIAITIGINSFYHTSIYKPMHDLSIVIFQ